MGLRASRYALCSAALVALCVPATAVGMAGASAPPLLLSANGATQFSATGVGHTAAEVSPGALDAASLRIDTDGAPVTAVRTALRHPRAGFTVWQGRVPGDARSSVLLVRHAGKVTGSLLVDGKPMQLRPEHGGHELIRNATAGRAEEPAVLPEGSGTVRTKARAAETSQIDVLVTATPAVEQGTDDLQALAELAVEETNKGYADSGIDAKLALTGVQVVDYQESDMDTDLDRMTDPEDGELDEVPQLRDEQQADVAVLLGNWSDYCGVSWIDADSSQAFSAVAADCATGNYSFGHEIGHLYGARHNPEEDDSTDPFPYGHGYLHSGDEEWRTIMAYDCPDGCPRLDLWSNPNKTYNGEPTGTADVSDNARVLNERRATLAEFR